MIPIGEEWTKTRGVSHPIFGVWSMCWGILCEVAAALYYNLHNCGNSDNVFQIQIFYIPCIYALYKERRQSCYRVWIHFDPIYPVILFTDYALACNRGCYRHSVQFRRLWLLSHRRNCFLFPSLVCVDCWLCRTGYGWLDDGVLHGVPLLGMWCGACIGCLLLVTYRLFELLNMSKRFEVRK